MSMFVKLRSWRHQVKTRTGTSKWKLKHNTCQAISRLKAKGELDINSSVDWSFGTDWVLTHQSTEGKMKIKDLLISRLTLWSWLWIIWSVDWPFDDFVHQSTDQRESCWNLTRCYSNFGPLAPKVEIGQHTFDQRIYCTFEVFLRKLLS
jgi:hypothetical protein